MARPPRHRNGRWRSSTVVGSTADLLLFAGLQETKCERQLLPAADRRQQRRQRAGRRHRNGHADGARRRGHLPLLYRARRRQRQRDHGFPRLSQISRSLRLTCSPGCPLARSLAAQSCSAWRLPARRRECSTTRRAAGCSSMATVPARRAATLFATLAPHAALGATDRR